MTENHPREDRHGPNVRVHPPIIYAISILSGIGLNNLWPLSMPFGLHGRLYGSIIIVAATLIAAWALLHFHRHDTDVRPDKPDSALITSGPYRFTRNPLYIVLTLAQITAAVWLDNLWILLLVVVSVIVITRYAITREELYLEQLFGQEYLKYKQRVRRWF
jgi:protein-S-isoprenylcysteine O-methyltransferase Ste14